MTESRDLLRDLFERYVSRWPNYNNRMLVRDGRYPDYYGNPVVQGAWEGWKDAMAERDTLAMFDALKRIRDLGRGSGGRQVFDRYGHMDAVQIATTAVRNAKEACHE